MARPTIFTHPKFRRLCHILSEPAPHVLGYLEFIWQVAYASGEARIGDALDVSLAAQYPGKPEVLVKAMLECGVGGRAGFLDETETGIFAVHDLLDHAPDYVHGRRQKELERQGLKECEHCGAEYRSTESHSRFCSEICRKASWRKKSGTDAGRSETDAGRAGTDGDGALRLGGTDGTQRDGPPTPAPAPAHTPTPTPNANTGSPEPGEAARSVQQPAEALLSFSVVGKGPSEWQLLQSKLDEYASCYPDLDVLAECRKARQWLIDNPSRRKTASGMSRFLNNWLARTQNRGSSQRSPPDADPLEEFLSNARRANDH